MPICKRSLPVKCKIDDAFEYIAEWSNLKDFMPMLLDLHPISLVTYGPGTSLEATLVIAKMEVATTLDLVEFLKNKRIVYKAARGIKSKIIWDLSQSGDEVIVNYSFEYEIPPGLVTRGSELEAIEKDMQERANQSMDLLKWVLEARTPGQDDRS